MKMKPSMRQRSFMQWRDAGYGASVKDAHEPVKKAENDLQKRTAEEAKR